MFLFSVLSSSASNFVCSNSLDFKKKFEYQKKIQSEISGVIKDKSGNLLPGVSVIIKGAQIGTSADFDGKYSISAKKGDILIFSNLGFASKEVRVLDELVINVVLEEDIAELDEVVVVGYGTQSKKDVTSTISVVNGDDIVSRSVTNVSNALQGATSGVSVTRSSGEPGASNTITIRGISTLQATNSPLVLVDDVPVRSINDVNPSEIESISVLKDAAAAAIYGSRAAAGVIIITTKSGKTGKFSVSYSTEFLINTPTEVKQNVSTVRYMQLENEFAFNNLNDPNGNRFLIHAEDKINNYAQLHQSDPNTYPDTDWNSLILKKQAETYRHNINISGGTEKIKTSANFGYEKQNALYARRDWERITGRINNKFQISDKLGVDLRIAFQQINSDQPFTNPTFAAINTVSLFPALWEDGRIAEGNNGGNPYARSLYDGFSSSQTNLIYGKFGVYFKPFKGLKISLNIAPNYNLVESKRFRNSIPYWGPDDSLQQGTTFYVSGNEPDDRVLIEARVNTKSVTTQALVNYDTSFDKHKISGVLGYEEFKTLTEGLRVRATGFTSNEFPYLNQAPTDQVFDNGTSISEIAYRSLFGRLSYNYDEKYYLEGTLRRDESSRFIESQRSAYFPSAGLSWVASNEKFLENNKFINYLKLRATYGVLGNDRFSDAILYDAQLEFNDVIFTDAAGNLLGTQSASQRELSNRQIKWEETATKNLGLDLKFLKNKLSVTTNIFNKKTTDMIIAATVAHSTGFSEFEPRDNVGDLETNGWELDMGWQDTIGDDFKYSISANFYDSESIVGYIDDKRLFSNGGRKLSEEGVEFASWFGYQSDGIFQTQDEVDNSPSLPAARPGDVKYKDISGPDGVPDGVISEEDQVVLDGSLPRYQFGGSINMSFKNFDLGLVFQGVGKQTFFLDNIHRSFVQNRMPSTELDGNFWSVDNTPEQNLSVKYPRLGSQSNNEFSDFWLVDGSYVRIKNITLGYTFPKDITEKLKVSQLRLYVAGNDLFTFDSLPNGVDPERTNTSGYLITSSYLFGLKVNF